VIENVPEFIFTVLKQVLAAILENGRHLGFSTLIFVYQKVHMTRFV